MSVVMLRLREIQSGHYMARDTLDLKTLLLSDTI